ncbi:hypothetical protein DKT68_19960 [Micromonospora acroterricola]|uniref:Uncharacterized protein n=1 Tax=Micromonospora acroterricola TaxID=2202421 RepID=A0A317D0J1_9ACTN|nr:hypothetical protein DKT68_19960 [Micromonospora acroterricola]
MDQVPRLDRRGDHPHRADPPRLPGRGQRRPGLHRLIRPTFRRTAAHAPPREPTPRRRAGRRTAPARRLIALTVAEIRRLLNAFVLALPLPPAHTLHGSTWRGTAQARVRRSHYQRRLGHRVGRKIK